MLTPTALLVAVPLLTLAPPLLWYVLHHRRQHAAMRDRRVDAMRWVARNLNAPSMRGSVVAVTDDGRIEIRPAPTASDAESGPHIVGGGGQ